MDLSPKLVHVPMALCVLMPISAGGLLLAVAETFGLELAAYVDRAGAVADLELSAEPDAESRRPSDRPARPLRGPPMK
ncbi:MAG TPA: hypothetical protein VI072_34005 [Polyangiaceae bacterium]